MEAQPQPTDGPALCRHFTDLYEAVDPMPQLPPGITMEEARVLVPQLFPANDTPAERMRKTLAYVGITIQGSKALLEAYKAAPSLENMDALLDFIERVEYGMSENTECVVDKAAGLNPYGDEPQAVVTDAQAALCDYLYDKARKRVIVHSVEHALEHLERFVLPHWPADPAANSHDLNAIVVVCLHVILRSLTVWLHTHFTSEHTTKVAAVVKEAHDEVLQGFPQHPQDLGNERPAQ